MGCNFEPALLLPYVKAQLGVTWDDAATDARYLQLIADGVAYVNDKLGTSGDYASPGGARVLVCQYVRYARDAALEVFEQNFTAQILALQNNRRVTAYAESVQSAGAGAEGSVADV